MTVASSPPRPISPALGLAACSALVRHGMYPAQTTEAISTTSGQAAYRIDSVEQPAREPERVRRGCR